MSTPNGNVQKKPRGGMASLAADLSSRAGSLAHRSTNEKLVSAASESEPTSSPQVPAEAVVGSEDAAKLAATSSDATRNPKPITRELPRPPSATARRPVRPTQAPRLAHPLAGPEGRLEASGELVVKMTLELAPQLIMALNVWERDETKRLGQRVFRERMIDLALDCLPEDVGSIVDLVTDLPPTLRHAPGQQFGTRVRASVRDKLLSLRPELRVAGVKNVRIRDVYSAGVYRYLVALGISIEDPSSVASS